MANTLETIAGSDDLTSPSDCRAVCKDLALLRDIRLLSDLTVFMTVHRDDRLMKASKNQVQLQSAGYRPSQTFSRHR